MKILCFIDGLCSGGAQRQLVGLAILLKKKKYDVSFMWYHQDDFYKTDLQSNDVKMIQLKTTNKFSKIFLLTKEIRKQSPDVIISYIDGPTMLSCLLKKLGVIKARVIVSERNTTQNISFHVKYKFYLYKYADYVVSNSYSQDHFIKVNFPSLTPKLQVITNFVDIDKFVPEYIIKKENFYSILVVGRISRQKNVLNFVKAVKLLRDERNDFRVDWYGTYLYNEDYYEEIIRTVSQLNLNNMLFFHEPAKNICEIYNQSDLFCLPSVFEGFPNVICEAMSCGLPIVCSNICDNPNIIEDGLNGYLFDPFDVVDIKNKICKFLDLQDNLKKSFSKRSREIAEGNFSAEEFLSKYEKLLEYQKNE